MTRTLPWPQPGGMETHAWELARAWTRRGWSVEILTTSFDQRDRVEEREGVRIHYLRHLPANRNEVPPWHWWHRFAQRVEDYAIGHRIDADVVHSESAYAWRLFRTLARQHHGAARTMTLHGTTRLTYREAGRPQLRARLPAWHPRAIAQALYVAARVRRERRRELPTAQRIVTVNPTLSHHVCQEYGVDQARVDVIPNGIVAPTHAFDRPALRTRLGIPRDARVLTYVGRLEPSKGLDRILAHMRNRPRDRFLVAGAGPDEPRLKRLASKLPNPGAVRFLGGLPEERKAELLAAADVFVLPSHSEGQPITLLESLAAGTPVYATHAWAPADLHDLIATGTDVTEGIEAAEALRPRAERRRGEILSAYSWDTAAARYEETFRRAKA